MNRSIFTNPYVLIAPAFLLAAFIILWPLFQIGEISVSEVNRFGQLRGFAGLDNFAEVLADPQFADALWRTVIWTVGIVAGTDPHLHSGGARPQARISTAAAYRAHHRDAALGGVADHDRHRLALGAERGERHAQFRRSRGSGLIDEKHPVAGGGGLRRFRCRSPSASWSRSRSPPRSSWAASSSIPDDLYEAGQARGASDWQIFFSITLPLLRRSSTSPW